MGRMSTENAEVKISSFLPMCATQNRKIAGLGNVPLKKKNKNKEEEERKKHESLINNLLTTVFETIWSIVGNERLPPVSPGLQRS